VHLNLLQAASIVAIVQAVLMAVFFLRNPKSRNLSNSILAAMLIIFALLTACSLFISSGVFFHKPQYRKPMFAVSQVVFLIGPLLYAYVHALLNPRFQLRPRHARASLSATVRPSSATSSSPIRPGMRRAWS
jgi:uncharacterized membrane protein YqjE